MRYLIILLSVIFLVSCDVNSSNVGPAGPPGEPGPVGQGFEVIVDFNQGNGFSQIIDISDIEVVEADIVAVYLLFEEGEQPSDDIFQPLPASFFFEGGGELQYAFDFTVFDVQLFLQGDIDLNTLSDDFTQNQVFRIAILPVDFVNSNDIDLSNMEEVMGVVGKNNFERLKL